MKIFLIRHGEKEPEGENSYLTKRGIKQAKHLAKKLNKIKFDEFYCSDLNRAKQTSEIVSKLIKVNPKIEKSLNEYEISDIEKDEKNWPKNERSRKKKLYTFLDKLSKKRNAEKNILIIAHGVTNRIVIAHLLELPLKKLIVFQQDNTCINLLKWSKKFKSWHLDKMNDSSHVPKGF